MTAVMGWLRQGLVLALAMAALGSAPRRQPAPNDLAVQAREAWVKRDRKRLAGLVEAARAQNHALTGWVEYFELNASAWPRCASRRWTASTPAIPGSYVEDRLRNDWLLELGRRRDWANFRRDHASYQMRDDREVACYALLADHAWRQQGRNRRCGPRRLDGAEGWRRRLPAGWPRPCVEAGQFKPDSRSGPRHRLGVEQSRPRAAQARPSPCLAAKPLDQKLAELQDNAGRYLTRKARTSPRATTPS